jgi:hypothetical protein
MNLDVTEYTARVSTEICLGNRDSREICKLDNELLGAAKGK